MTAWVLLLTIGANVFAVSSIATQADCDTLATAIGQAASGAQVNHACISYEQASAVSEVHVFGMNEPKVAAPAPPQFHVKQKPK